MEDIISYESSEEVRIEILTEREKTVVNDVKKVMKELRAEILEKDMEKKWKIPKANKESSKTKTLEQALRTTLLNATQEDAG